MVLAFALLGTLTSLVDPFIGTAGTGHTHPGATAPFGMVQAGPDTGAGDWDHCSAYQYKDARILGFSQTHLSGTGWVDYGDVQIIPYADNRYRDDGSRFDKSTERAKPGYYAVELADFGVTVEATASERVAIYRMRFPTNATANLIVNLPFGVYEKRWARKRWIGHGECVESPRLISGHYRRSVWATRNVAYAIAFDADATITRLEPVADEPPRFKCAFGRVPGGELIVRVALSKTDADGAKRNLATAAEMSFDVIRLQTEGRWEDLLARFRAEGDRKSLRKFYTALYHCAVQPNLMTDADEKPLYTTFSFWDAGRACYPLYALWTPEMVSPLIDSFLHFYRRQGYLPIFTVGDSETRCMIANHVVPVLENWRRSGVAPDVDWKAVANAAARSLRTSTEGRDDRWNYDLLNRQGYFAHDKVRGQSVSSTLEAGLDDAAMARLATGTGNEEDARFFADRAYAWTNLFDVVTGFFRGKNADRTWRMPFDVLRVDHGTTRGGEFTEGNAWQHRWHVMQHPEALVETMGGAEKFAQELDRLFALPSRVFGGASSSDVTGLIGQYAHGNEPCHHVPYFYQYAGRPDRTAEKVREICETLYSDEPDGLCGNDDCGQLSAWYVFASLGFYPFDPSSGAFVLGAPQLSKVTVRLPGGRSLTVVAKGLSESNKYVKSVSLNGRTLDGFTVGQAEILAGGVLEFEMTSGRTSTGEDSAADVPDLARYVNLLVGTDGFGNTCPGPTWPLGMVQPGPDTFKTYWSSCNGYKWKSQSVAGFSQTHLSGTGCSELQDVALLPFAGDLSAAISDYRTWASKAFAKSKETARGVPRKTLICGEMDKRSEVAEVGYYAVSLTNWNVRVELTASKRVAYHRYTFAKGDDAHVYVNLQAGPSRWWRQPPADRMSAARSAWDAEEGILSGYGCSTAMVIDRDVAFALAFSVPPKRARKLPALDGWNGDRWVFDFDLRDGGSVVAKVALSTRDERGARLNLAADGDDFDFDHRRQACRAAWNRLLDKVNVTAPTDRKVQIYTALYHAYFQPNVISDADGAYRNGLRGLEPGEGFEMYSTFSLWDTFRAAHPLYTILTPERASDFARSMIAHHRAVGRLPRWETWGRETDDMVVLHSVPVVVDAVLKDLPGMDAEAAYKAVDDSLADRGPHYDKYGYFPWQDHWRATSVTIEWCYDDWCAAVLADRLGKTERAAFYRKRADYWKNLFDPATGYMRGKDAAGNWHEPFDPYKQCPNANDPWTSERPDRRTHDYVEGSALQYNWHILHDPDGLIAQFGGKGKFYTAFNRFFTLPTKLPGQVLTCESTGCIGQYAHGNEPAHHVPYYFQFVGRPDRTAEIVRQICDTYYQNRPDGLVGNDDCGQMSAWFVFTCLGFYPFNPCGGDYVLGAPQVPKAEIKVGGEGECRTFRICAKGLSAENKYVKSVSLNGKPLAGFVLKHEDIVAGGELLFEMTDRAEVTGF